MHMYIYFASLLSGCVSVCVFIAFVCVCDFVCLCMFFWVRTSLYLFVGFLRGGFLPGQRPRPLRV